MSGLIRRRRIPDVRGRLRISALADPSARFGFFAALCSGFGQTYFIGLFGHSIRHALDLTPGSLGLYYAIATLASGGTMFWFGGHADHAAPRSGITLAFSILAFGCVLLASTYWVPLLVLAFYALRLGGQGLSGHYAIVAVGRSTGPRRGRIIAVATFGFLVAEAVWPNVVGRLLGHLPWRALWLASAVLLLLALLPLARHLAAPLKLPETRKVDAADQLSRRRLLLSPSFVGAIGLLLVGPVVISAFMFQQSVFAVARGWTAGQVADAFLFFAAGQAAGTLLAGGLVERLGVYRLMMVQLLPLALAMVVFGLLPSVRPFWFFAPMGMTMGLNAVTVGVLWPELYGQGQLGLVRGVYAAIMVAGTAISPALLGWALDAQVSQAALALGVTAYCVLMPWPLLRPMRAQLRRQACRAA